MLLFFLRMFQEPPLHGLARESHRTERVELVAKDTDNPVATAWFRRSIALAGCSGAICSARRSRDVWRAPVRLDHPPHREDEDEIRGARGAAVGASNSRGTGRDGTQRDHCAVAAARAHPVAGFRQEGRRRRGQGRSAAGPAPRVPPPRDCRACRLGRHGDAELGGRAGGPLGAHGRPGRAAGALNPDRAGRRTLGSHPGTWRSTSQTWKHPT
jgi:hypothetical protein